MENCIVPAHTACLCGLASVCKIDKQDQSAPEVPDTMAAEWLSYKIAFATVSYKMIF